MSRYRQSSYSHPLLSFGLGNLHLIFFYFSTKPPTRSFLGPISTPNGSFLGFTTSHSALTLSPFARFVQKLVIVPNYALGDMIRIMNGN
jgi:hypothetical protein